MALGRLGDGHTEADVERNLEEMRDAGFPEAAIEAARAEAATTTRMGPFEVHPDNTTAVRAFLAMQTQWRISARSTWSAAELVRTGLDYGVLKETAALAGAGKIRRDDFRRIQFMEAEALDAWAKDAKARR